MLPKPRDCHTQSKTECPHVEEDLSLDGAPIENVYRNIETLEPLGLLSSHAGSLHYPAQSVENVLVRALLPSAGS